MVIRSPFNYNPSLLGDSICSDNDDKEEYRSNKETSVEDIQSEYEKLVVPNMMERNWGTEIAKSKSSPYNNKVNQTLIGHILPGLDIFIDMYSILDMDLADIRHAIALWTIHDYHKLTNGFDIRKSDIEPIIGDLRLREFAPGLSISDYRSCSTALHMGGNSNHGDMTERFTQLRPYLRLVDAVRSIDSPYEFVQNCQRNVRNVSDQLEPQSHTVNIKDNVTRHLVNEAVSKSLRDRGYHQVDYRENGSLYLSDENITDVDSLVDSILENYISNLENSYQMFRNKSILGTNINSPRSRSDRQKSRVYNISEISRVCLSKEEIIQRIVQASTQQQTRDTELAEESIQQINKIENLCDISIPRNQRVEGMAALVHTVYRELLPDIVSDNPDDNVHERSRLAAIIHIFQQDEEMQDKIVKCIKSDNIPTSSVQWSIKYLIAKDLIERLGEYPPDKRRNILLEEILSQLSEYEKWKETNISSDMSSEFRVLISSKVEINGEPLYLLDEDSECRKIVSDMIFDDTTEKCPVCTTPTVQSLSPKLISPQDFDILRREFSTNSNHITKCFKASDNLSGKSLCALCQVSLSTRSKQLNTFYSDMELNSTDEKLHVTIQPSSSYSRGATRRFQTVLNFLKDKLFSEKFNGFDVTDIVEYYSNTVNEYDRRSLFRNESRIREVGERFDPTKSILTLPKNSNRYVYRGALAASLSALICGVNVTITKRPQLQMSQTDSIVNFGPEISEMSPLFQNTENIEKLIDRINIIESTIKLGQASNKEVCIMENLSDITNANALCGSALFNTISDNIDREDKKKAAKHALNIDKITAKNSSYNEEIELAVQALSYHTTKITESRDTTMIKTVVRDSFDCVILSTKMNNYNIKRSIVSSLTNMDYVSGKSSDINDYASAVVRIFDELCNSDPDNLDEIIDELIHSVTVRALTNKAGRLAKC
jgi:predicted transcriptional regulator